MSAIPHVFLGIQSLRFLAAALVVLMHGTHYSVERLVAGPIFINGAAGVDVFFVISGFVMMMSSESLFSREGGWRTFAVRRVVRIVPLYWALLSLKVATLIFLPAALSNTQISWTEVLASYLFIPHYNAQGAIAPILVVGWTLNFEMFFYAILAVTMSLRQDPYRLTIGILIALAIGACFRPSQGSALLFYFDPIVLEFGYGMLIARYVRSVPGLSPRVGVGLLVMGVAALCVPVATAPGLTRAFVWGLPAASIVLGVCALERSLSSVPRRVLTVATKLGDCSYALYLVHPLVGPLVPSVLAKAGVASTSLSVAGTLCVSVVAAWLVHVIVEKPTTQWLKGRRAIGGDGQTIPA